ncbi:hypothetical protein N7462_008514 [Penicillium macrosclerotiorum]|uniref:uncharacterized protein n=1 Tax=Penicillium macrosclerotiorum TaxID=303699 RepID=UPI002546FF2A|nr:uncharacterized protein N7462_008514 [Penicillium macrosclerotiorum]KAJ5675617.1 hypothetical protein N7462_008514 [Penicillium macrosclerotiorum]
MHLGCHITIFARRQQKLDEAKSEVLAARRHEKQEVKTQSLDLTDATAISETFKAQPRLPDILYCVAGGTTNELGFLVDLSPDTISRCMTNNYLTSAYPAQAILKLWTEDDKSFQPPSGRKSRPKTRQLVFVSSAAAFIALPGYTVYTPAKCAVRALADGLRTELMRYSGPASQYSVHIAFPSNFISPSFVDEQKTKPQLTKELEGTTAPLSELSGKIHSAKDVADAIIAAVDKKDFIICSELEAALLFGAMNGIVPRRGFGVMDSLIAMVQVIVGPLVRRWLDYKCSSDSALSETRAR